MMRTNAWNLEMIHEKKRAARRSATPANGTDSLMVAAVVPVVGGQFGRFLILNVCLLRELTGQRVEHLAARK